MVDMYIDLLETLYNFWDFFKSAFKQYIAMNKQNAACSHFFGPLGTSVRKSVRTPNRIVAITPQMRTLPCWDALQKWYTQT